MTADEIPVALRDVTPGRCLTCGVALLPGRQRAYCSARCRQTGYRRRQGAQPLVIAAPVGRRRQLSVYQCPECDARYLGDQYCAECRTFCVLLGVGGTCPSCEEPVAANELADVVTTAGPHAAAARLTRRDREAEPRR